MLLGRHAVRLLREVLVCARMNRAWWILPVTAMLLAVVLLSTAAHAAVPYAVYTLF